MPLSLDDRDRLRYSTTGALGGFNTGDYGGDRKARNSVKNTFGRIASRYASAPNSLDAVMQDADFRAAFPNARKVGHDKIDFGGVQSDFESGTPVGIVDVLEASDPSNNSAKRWQWLTDDGGAGTGGGGAAQSSASSYTDPMTGARSYRTSLDAMLKYPWLDTANPNQLRMQRDDVSHGYDGMSGGGGFAYWPTNSLPYPNAKTGGGAPPMANGATPVDQVSQWYRDYLGREPSSDEVQGWLSGRYGWGNSNNLEGIWRGLASSGEANNVRRLNNSVRTLADLSRRYR